MSKISRPNAVSDEPITAKAPALGGAGFSPVRFFLITVGGIFFSEVVAMIFIMRLAYLPYYLQTLIDALVMEIMIFPLVYFFSLKPLIRQVEKEQRARRALRKSEERFEKAFHSSPIASTITRASDGSFIDANERFLQLCGYQREQVIGHNALELGLYADPGEREALMRKIASDGGARDFEVLARTRSGEILNVVLSTESIELGDEPCILGSMSDITEHKRDEEKLRWAYDEMELRVQERTRELQRVNQELDEEIKVRRQTESALRESEQRLNRAQEIAHLGSWELDLASNQLTWSDEVYRIFGLQPNQFGATYEAFLNAIHPQDRVAVDQAYSSSVREGRDHYEIEHRVIRRPSGEVRVVHEKCDHFRDAQGCIIRSIGMVHDITERRQAEDALRAAHDKLEIRVAERTQELSLANQELQAITRLERLQRQFSEALVEAALALNKSMKLDEVLPLILEQIKEVIPYRLANVMLLDGEFVYDASHQGEASLLEVLPAIGSRFSMDELPLLLKMQTSGEPLLIADSQQDPGWTHLKALEWVGSSLSAPLLVDQKVIGFVNLFAQELGFYTQDMRNRLEAFAAHAAVAIQNAWLFEQARAGNERLQFLSRRLVEVQENERHYISRELHDEAGQALSSLLLDLSLLEKDADQPKLVLKKAAEMEHALHEVIENLHRLAMALRPASLDHLGLVAALQQQVESVREKYGLRVRFKALRSVKRLPENIETVIYRIVQEALTNVVRHAHATEAEVILTVRNRNLVVIVEDNGVGFDPAAVPGSDHMGLFGMLERAQMIGARLLVESAPGEGTTIMLEVDDGNSLIGRG